jgi:hypothetical protein
VGVFCPSWMAVRRIGTFAWVSSSRGRTEGVLERPCHPFLSSSPLAGQGLLEGICSLCGARCNSVGQRSPSQRNIRCCTSLMARDSTNQVDTLTDPHPRRTKDE